MAARTPTRAGFVAAQDEKRRQGTTTRVAAAEHATFQPRILRLPGWKTWWRERHLSSHQCVSSVPRRNGMGYTSFASATCGVLQTTLAAGHKVKVYTYCDRDLMSQKKARSKLLKLQIECPSQLPDSAIKLFDKRLPRVVSLISSL